MPAVPHTTSSAATPAARPAPAASAKPARVVAAPLAAAIVFVSGAPAAQAISAADYDALTGQNKAPVEKKRVFWAAFADEGRGASKGRSATALPSAASPRFAS